MAMEDRIGTVVIPGDNLGHIDPTSDDKEKLRLGPGLRQESGKVLAYKAGVLRSKKPRIFWIDSNQKRVRLNSYHIISDYFDYNILIKNI